MSCRTEFKHGEQIKVRIGGKMKPRTFVGVHPHEPRKGIYVTESGKPYKKPLSQMQKTETNCIDGKVVEIDGEKYKLNSVD